MKLHHSWVEASVQRQPVRPSQPVMRVGTNTGFAAATGEKERGRFSVNILWNGGEIRFTTSSWFQARKDMSISGRIKSIKQGAVFSIDDMMNPPDNVIGPGSPLAPATKLPNHSAIPVRNGRTGTAGIRARR